MPPKREPLTDLEVAALVEACAVADGLTGSPKPPWNTHGKSAWNKLLDEQEHRASRKRKSIKRPRGVGP